MIAAADSNGNWWLLAGCTVGLMAWRGPEEYCERLIEARRPGALLWQERKVECPPILRGGQNKGRM